MRKLITLIICLLPIICVAQFAKNTTIEASQSPIISKLEAYSLQHFIEKAYLHFDKPYYAGGDTMFFKAYLIMGEKHKLSTISTVLYVDLINTRNKIDQSIKLQVSNGVAVGDFALPDTLPSGNYQIRAYTKWMHNDGGESYFYLTITVSSLHNSNTTSITVTNPKSQKGKADIQFFPEGGALIADLKSKIAFKAINKNGLGIDVKGVILDNDNKEITRFASSHLGMGSFQITPQAGKTYQAKLSYQDGTENKVMLPAANVKGIALYINNDSLPKASVRIEANKTYYEENKDKEFTVLIYSGGLATAVNCKLDSPLITFDIIKRRLHTGIARVTLFSSDREPLCERILFVQNYDQLSFALKSDKEFYNKREKVNINIHVQNRAAQASKGNFSISVVDEDKVPLEENAENTILTNLLLTSDLKGYVEQPNYYFSNSTDKTNSDLDLVMLTHGYRRFDWKQLVNNEYPPIKFQPDTNLEITGVAESLSGKPLASATVSLIEMHNGKFYSRVTDQAGNFKFNNLVFSDTAKFILQAVNKKGRNLTKLVYKREFGDTVIRKLISPDQDTIVAVMKPYMENKKKQDDNDVKYGRQKGKLLKTVVIKAKKIEDENFNLNLPTKAFADQVIDGDLLAPGGTFVDRVEGSLHNIQIQHKGIEAYAYVPGLNNPPVPMGIFLDGADMGTDLNRIAGLDIKDIEVTKFQAGGGGVLVINTKKPGDRKVESIGVLPISPKGFYKAREFYSPKYTPDNIANNRPDLRSTIYWKPELITGANGEASFGFFNADGTGNYKITIEGMDENGNIGRLIYRYRVE